MVARVTIKPTNVATVALMGLGRTCGRVSNLFRDLNRALTWCALKMTSVQAVLFSKHCMHSLQSSRPPLLRTTSILVEKAKYLVRWRFLGHVLWIRSIGPLQHPPQEAIESLIINCVRPRKVQVRRLLCSFALRGVYLIQRNLGLKRFVRTGIGCCAKEGCERPRIPVEFRQPAQPQNVFNCGHDITVLKKS